MSITYCQAMGISVPSHAECNACGKKPLEGCWSWPAERQRWVWTQQKAQTRGSQHVAAEGGLAGLLVQVRFQVQISCGSRSRKINFSMFKPSMGELLGSETDHKQQDAKGRGRCSEDLPLQAVVPIKGSSLPWGGLCCEAHIRVLRRFGLQGARGHGACRSEPEI